METLQWIELNKKYLPAHRCGCTQTMMTNQITGSWRDIPQHRKHSSATSSPVPAARENTVLCNPSVKQKHYSDFNIKCYTTHLFAELEVNRFAITTHTVQHAGFDAISTHCSVTELASAPVCRETFHHQITHSQTASCTINIKMCLMESNSRAGIYFIFHWKFCCLW